MDVWMASEQAYKNGYVNGYYEAFKDLVDYFHLAGKQDISDIITALMEEENENK